MKRLLIAVMAVLALSACQAAPLVRVSMQGLADRPPEIDKVVDLGSLSVAPEGELDRGHTDELFIAGEWVVVAGKGLNAQSSRVFLDDIELPVKGGIKGGGLLLRIPPEVLYRHTYTLRVETPLGADQTTVPVSNFIVMSDVRSNKVYLWRSSPDEDGVFDEEPFTIDCSRAGPFAVSPSGGVLYVAAQGNRSKGAELPAYELKAIHLGAKEGPAEISSLRFESENMPVSLVVSRKGSFGFLLTSNELLVFDLSQPGTPRFVSRQKLIDQSEKKIPILKA